MSNNGIEFAKAGVKKLTEPHAAETGRAGSGIPKEVVSELPKIGEGETRVTKTPPFIAPMIKYEEFSQISYIRVATAGKFKNPDAPTLSNNILKSQDKFVSR